MRAALNPPRERFEGEDVPPPGRIMTFDTAQASDICGVGRNEIYRWFVVGELLGYRLPGCDELRIPREFLIKTIIEKDIKMSTEITTATGELIDAGTSLAFQRDMAIVRMENETMMSVCQQRPRKMENIKTDLGIMLHSFPAFAAAAVYVKPIGKDIDGNMAYAEGLSVRAAECLAEAYGSNKVRADVTPIDEDSVKIEAVFTDYQTGRIWSDSGIVSVFYKSRSGKLVRHSPDRFNDVVLKAAKSKLIREVILRSVNPALKEWFEAECKAANKSTLEGDTTERLLAAFSGVGVTQSHLETITGKPQAEWKSIDVEKLRGIFAAIRDEEITLEQLLNPEAEAEAVPPGDVAQLQKEIDEQKAKNKKLDRKGTPLPSFKRELANCKTPDDVVVIMDQYTADFPDWTADIGLDAEKRVKELKPPMEPAK